MRIVKEIALWKLSLTMIVLNLVTFSSLIVSMSPQVLSLETGYDYGMKKIPTTLDRYRDLKCTYLLAGMTHMRLIKLMLEDKNISIGFPVGTVRHYDIRAAICTLYDVKSNREIVGIGSLWLLLLYANTVQFYYKQYVVHSTNVPDRNAAVNRLEVIHDYLAARMQMELSVAGCRPGNRFDSYEERYARIVVAMALSGENKVYHIQNEALNNCHELDKLFNANNAKSTFGTRYESLKARHLFLDNLGINKTLKAKLMTAYDVQVGWGDTFKVLKQNWENAHKFYSPTVLSLPLFSVKRYYKAVFGLFKCIMYRLTWKFLLYVDTFTAERRSNHLKKWHDLLVEFQNLLRLHHDRDVVNLLVAIVHLSNNNVVVDNVITKLRVKLHDINVWLLCEAANEMIKKPEQFHSNAVEGTSSQVDIDWNSVKDALAFIAELKSSFRLVDFDVIRSFVTYISNENNW